MMGGRSIEAASVAAIQFDSQETGDDIVPLKPEPPVPPPQDNQQRRDNLAQSASATDALRNAFSRHTTSRQDPGRDRQS